MPRPSQPVSADQALTAVAEAVGILSDLRTPQPDPQLDEQIAALVQAGFVFARNANPNA